MNFADQRKAAASRLSKSPAPKGKDYAYPTGKPDYMKGTDGTDVTSLNEPRNHQNLVNTPVYINRSGRGGTSKNY